MEKDQSVVLTARIPADLHRRAKAKLAESGLSFQDVIADTIRNVTSTETRNLEQSFQHNKVKIKSGDITNRESPWVEKLLRILRSGTQLSKSIQENLDGFCAGLDAMQEVERLTAQLKVAGERHGPSNASAAEPGDLARGIERAGRIAGEARRTLEGAGEHGKGVRKKKA
ncbi:MAG TPA: hypothetical protein VN579_07275 [Bryobacteraceae bacterium]|nr:hypothetical protein [Bryobacteraceae bacterium]